ncbi:MAG: hypothetical protein JST58_08990 [Bacteroidetes bacterium]|nr:hypothetical protein [Bacteroidota bacterium]
MSSTNTSSPNILLKHSLKAIEYRFIKATAGSKQGFGEFKANASMRSPSQIINHIFDLVSKMNMLIKEGHFNSPSPQNLDFASEQARFLLGIKELEMAFGKKKIDMGVSKKLLQGPILDIATHVGQLAMLNGIFGSPVAKESYYEIDL